MTDADVSLPGSDTAHGSIERTFRNRTAQSAVVGKRAERVMPGGDTRAAGYHPPYPITLVRGSGPHLWDADNNRYWDLSYNFTSLVHGHGHPAVIDAALETVHTGTAWPARNPQQIELAELLVERVASVDSVRFCNSGSEATMLALQAAKVITGRSKMLMARWGYHGGHESFEVGTWDGAMHVPGTDDTLVSQYGNAAEFEQILTDNAEEVAAVFLEPVMGAGGVVEADPNFYREVQAACRRAGALFVLDEVISFRLAMGGRQETLGIDPDLTTFGKIIGGGFPVGALGGKREHMSVLDPRQHRMFHSGTFNGNPVTSSAGIATLRHLTAERIEDMALLAEQLHEGLVECAARAGLPLSIRRVGSLLNLYLSSEPPESNALRRDRRAMALLHLAGMNRGLYFAPRGMLVLSTVMDQSSIGSVLDRFEAAFADVAIELPDA
jgi:glutamate-1-semialdehyde 2,1-aminomutase